MMIATVLGHSLNDLALVRLNWAKKQPNLMTFFVNSLAIHSIIVTTLYFCGYLIFSVDSYADAFMIRVVRLYNLARDCVTCFSIHMIQKTAICGCWLSDQLCVAVLLKRCTDGCAALSFQVFVKITSKDYMIKAFCLVK